MFMRLNAGIGDCRDFVGFSEDCATNDRAAHSSDLLIQQTQLESFWVENAVWLLLSKGLEIIYYTHVKPELVH